MTNLFDRKYSRLSPLKNGIFIEKYAEFFSLKTLQLGKILDDLNSLIREIVKMLQVIRILDIEMTLKSLVFLFVTPLANAGINLIKVSGKNAKAKMD